jgi:predicted extracellular nuclease/2',3'-cyclic-nucleotide 2'-phosphodiesterase (5'-nucleotidase family)
MPTTLTAGDIAFTAFQADNPDAFEFVLLTAVTTGTTIYFTDNGYRTDLNAFRTNENVLRWVAQGDLAAGTKIIFTDAGTPTAEWTGINPQTGAELTNTTFGLSTSGDQIAALVSPTFGGADLLNGTAIAAINFGAATYPATFTDGANNSLTALPPGLTDGTTAVSVGSFDNGRYDPAVPGSTESGAATDVRTSVNTDANWELNETAFGSTGTTATFAIGGGGGDTTAPTLSNSSPLDNAVGVSTAGNIVLTFDEAVQAGTGNIVISDGAGDTRTISVTDSSQVTFSGSTVTINPTASLNAGTAYDVTMASGVITDTAANPFAGIAADALDFTTAAGTIPGATNVGGIAVLEEADSLQGSAATPTATNAVQLVRLGSFAATGGNAEVVSFDPVTDRLYILNATGNKIEVVQIASTGALTKTGEIDLSSLTDFGSANSVAVKNGVVAVAYGNTAADAAGHVALFDTATLSLQNNLTVGVLPDMLTFTPDGSRILVANEAEAISTVNNPNGSISIIDLSGGAASATVQTTIGFTALNGSETLLDDTLGLSLFNGQSAAADIEPEYISVSPDGTRAYVTLQEVNAVAVIDLTDPAATAPIAILPLGSIDRSLAGNEFDGSDQDGPGTAGKINIQNWSVRSLLQPDAIASFAVGGVTYFITANEGDARVGTGLTGEEVRLSSGGYDLDNTDFPNETALKNSDAIGRLNVINHEGNTDADAQIEVITTYGGRGISIFRQNADGTIEKVRETGGEFEKVLASQPNANLFFNSTNAFGGDGFDTRSDNKGPEPEGVDIGVINGRTYAFVTLERAGGVMMYDVTDPANANFVGYKPPLPPGITPSPDNAPETIKFISAADSPTGTALVVTANEVGNGTTVYAVVTPIYQLQGTGHVSAYTGQSVSTTGVVTAVDTNGFYIQDATGDGNAATSDAIFIFTSSAPTVSVGQEVMVSGTVTEFVPAGVDAPPGALSITEIVSPTVVTLGVGAAIAPVQIGGSDGIAPPTGGDLAAGGAFYEALEGMLVKVKAPVAIGPTTSNGEIWTVVDNDDNAANGLNATGLTSRGTIQFTPGTGEPDDPGTVGTDSLGSTNTIGGDFNPERIQIDDDSGVLSGFSSPLVNPGARLSDVTGVVSYNFGNYEVVATQAYTVTQASTLVKETTTLVGTANRLTVASYNAENLDANDPTARFTTIADEILNKLKLPDIIALQEIQDNDGTAGGVGSTVAAADQTLQELLDALNAVVPAGVMYKAIDNPFITDDANGGQPGGNIRNAFLYREDRVDLVDGSLRTIGVNGTSIDTLPGNADQQSNVEHPFYNSRPPLVATFQFNGQDVTIVNNHFSSKGGSAELFGTDQPPFNASEVQRAAQAQAVNNFVDSLLTGNANAKIIVGGDLNEFPSEEPMQVIKGTATISNYDVPASNDPFDATATYTPGGTAVLHDLLETLPAEEQYDYFFDGNVQTLDHLLVTGGLQSGAQFDVVRINAEFNDQTSDHDPLVASFNIPVQSAPGTYKLQILHASDFEAGLGAIDDAPRFAAIVDRLEDLETNSITLASGDNYIPSPFFNASSDPALDPFFEESIGRADIRILNTIGIEASVIGNHEFDAGPREVQNLIRPAGAGADGGGTYEGTRFPYLAANLNFSGEPDLNPNATTNPITEANFGTGASGGLRLGRSAIIDENGEKIGVVGVTTPVFESITTPGGVRIIGPQTLDANDGDDSDFVALVAIVQAQIDALTAQGVNKIVIVSQLQELENEIKLISFLRDVDIVIGGGSNTLLSDSNDVLRTGDTSDGEYGQIFTNAGGTQTVLVNTDGNYKYVGRLVVEFDSNGLIIPASLDPNVNGAYATDAAGLARVYDGTGIDPFAEGSKGETVQDVTEVIDGVISVKDASQFGRTDVYIDGRRGEVRSQETNLGNLSADANLFYAKQTDASAIISIKNGGGIRDSIGSFGDAGQELPPAANPDANKQAGEVSQLDIENSLRFNNALSLVTLTPQQLLEALENGVSNPGGIFGQVGGLRFSYDLTRPVGDRVRSVALVNEAGELTDVIVRDGDVVADAPSAIRMVTLSFLIGAATAVTPATPLGFQRPDGFRFAEYIAANPTFANRVDLDPDSSGADDVAARAGVATFTDNGREQDALAEYLANKYSFDPFSQADTPQSLDERIQNLGVRKDTVLNGATTDGSSDIDVLNGTDGNDTINGLGGNDLIRAGLGDDSINGGDGDDTAAFNVDFNSVQVVVENGNIVIVSAEGRDTVRNTEHFQFLDGEISVNDGNPLVDDLFYFARNKDVWDAQIDADLHFNAIGWKEGRDPNPEFSTKGYLSANADVKVAGINPLDHYHQTGWLEGRDPSAVFDTDLYLLKNPDVAAANIDPLAHYLASGRSEGRQAFAAVGENIANGFDAEFYLLSNPDVGAAGFNALQHFQISGWKEGRDPSAFFDTSGYLATYTDVAAANINPLDHYMAVGWTEGRDPSTGFDTTAYLAANPDVAAANVNPLQHFLQFGIYEGRSPQSDGLWG